MFKRLIEIRDQIYIGLILILFVSFPMSFAINSISMFLFIPFFFLDKKPRILEKFKKITTNKLNLLFALFFLVQLIGVFYSENIDFALKRLGIMLPILFLPSIVSAESLSKKHFSFILKLVTYTVVIIFLYYIFIHIIIDKRDINTFIHFTVEKKIGISQFYLIFLLLIPILTTINLIRNNENRVLNSLILMATIGISFLLGNKTMLIFMVLIWIVLTVSSFKKTKKSGLIVLFSGCIVFALVSQLTIIKQRVGVFIKTTDLNLETIKTKNSFTITKNTFEHRVLLNSISTKEIAKSLPFGVGTGDYQNILHEHYKKLNFKAALASNFNSHNQYLSEFLKTGFLGGTLFLMLIAWLLLKINFKQKFYPYFIVFFALACFVESFLVRQHGIVIFAFIIPFFLYNEQTT